MIFKIYLLNHKEKQLHSNFQKVACFYLFNTVLYLHHMLSDRRGTLGKAYTVQTSHCWSLIQPAINVKLDH